MAKNKKCEICGESPAYTNGKNWFCVKHYTAWIIKTFVIAGIIILIYNLI